MRLTTKNLLSFIAVSTFFNCSLAIAEGTVISTSASHGLEFIAPKGRFVLRTELRQNDYDKFYDSNADKQNLGATLNNVNLNSSVFPDLAAFGATASLGTTQFSTNVKTQRIEFTLGYGLSEDVTVGAIIPYGKVTTNASFNITGGNVGFNPAFNSNLPSSNTNPALLPVGLGATSPVGTAGVQTIISSAEFGLGYKPITSTSWEGFGDPTLGILWRAYQSPKHSIIIGGGIRFGVAKDVNPDDLLQIPIDDGSTDLRARAEYYRDLGQNFDLKLAAEFTYQSKDKVTRRLPATGALLAAASTKESLRRNLGNYREFDIGLGKAIGDWRISGTWHRYVKDADHYSSSINTDTSGLELNTALFANQWRAAVSWSGIKAWQNGGLPLPLIVQLEIQKTYEAENFPAVDDVYLQLTSFF